MARLLGKTESTISSPCSSYPHHTQRILVSSLPFFLLLCLWDCLWSTLQFCVFPSGHCPLIVSFTFVTSTIIPLGETPHSVPSWNLVVELPIYIFWFLPRYLLMDVQWTQILHVWNRTSQLPFPLNMFHFMYSLFWLVSLFFRLPRFTRSECLYSSPFFCFHKFSNPVVCASHLLHSRRNLKWNVSEFLHLSPAVHSQCYCLAWVLICCDPLLGHPAFSFSLLAYWPYPQKTQL